MESDLAPPANPANPQENTGEISGTQRATELDLTLYRPARVAEIAVREAVARRRNCALRAGAGEFASLCVHHAPCKLMRRAHASSIGRRLRRPGVSRSDRGGPFVPSGPVHHGRAPGG